MMSNIPKPFSTERPVLYADRIGRWHSSITPSEIKKLTGQYMTSVSVAEFMASLVTPRIGKLRILDPGAGAGILTCALCELLVSQKDKPTELFIDIYESDVQLIPVLKKVISHLKSYLEQRGLQITVDLKSDDFVLANAKAFPEHLGLFGLNAKKPLYDIVISNPPYFKLRKDDPRAKAARAIVHGQPNIYAIFLAISACLLSENGDLVFITPRSFTSGPYFRLFRERFFELVVPEVVHTFDSRRELFKVDNVLQENIILKAKREEGWLSDHKKRFIIVSTSSGESKLSDPKNRKFPLSCVLDLESPSKVFHIPTNSREKNIINRFKAWNSSLSDFGINISTGPVVPFRANGFLLKDPYTNTPQAPLLWMHNVRAMRIEWPTQTGRKPQYISISSDSDHLLLPNKNYVLFRRFTTKEETRRLVAAPLVLGQLKTTNVGLENHLNYMHRPGGFLSVDEVFGFSAIYNSEFFDLYFRTLNGNTQVSATELRAIPLPSLKRILIIGELVRKCQRPWQEVEQRVNDLLFDSI
jgi:adenine-specific DNA-methyltransferase